MRYDGDRVKESRLKSIVSIDLNTSTAVKEIFSYLGSNPKEEQTDEDIIETIYINKEQKDEEIIETIMSTRNRQMKTSLKPLI